jgi:hypothetical protein
MRGRPLDQLIFVLAGLMLIVIFLARRVFPAWEPWVHHIQIAVSVVQMLASGFILDHADQRGPYTRT